MEAIVSILLLTIMMTTITLMIQTSLRLTANSMREAERMQELVFNHAILDNFESLPPEIVPPGTITSATFNFVIKDNDWDIEVQHLIRVYEIDSDIISFYP